MIHNLTVQPMGLRFTVITEIGKVECTVSLYDKDKDGRPKLFAAKYYVLGIEYVSGEHCDNKVMVAGIKALGRSVQEVCNNNGWNCWSY